MSYDEIIGTIGVSLILVAYFCNTFGWLKNTGLPFFILNAAGAALACYASWLIRYWPFVILEGTWFIVSLIGIIKTSR